MLVLATTFTETGDDGLETQPVLELVKVNVAVPGSNAETFPLLLMLATKKLLVDHVPPVEGVNVVVPPTHKVEDPVNVATGLALIVTVVVGLDTHPVVELVNVKVTVPSVTPVTTPAFVTVAIDVLLLTHVPPVVGDSVVVAP